MSTDFSSLRLSAPLLRALTDEGYTIPTPIQAKAIPTILEGRDLLGCAQTGTGKTAAFALPILHRLAAATADTKAGPATDHAARRGPVLPRVLVLAPTRELATQIGDSFKAYGRHTNLRHAVVFGGVSQFHQVRALERGIDVLVATPGRLMDLMEQGFIKLTAINTLVLDEADRMLDMGFIQPIRRIVSSIPKARQTLLFSATMPAEIMRLADSLLTNPVKVAVTPVASAAPMIEQSLYMVSRNVKQGLLHHLLENQESARAIVFTKTKHGADRVTKRLLQVGVTADAIHGNKAQNRRQRTLDGFRSGKLRVLVATDVAARGLDIDGVTHIFNFDLPMEPEAYVHRIGRTARAGASGIAISFCDAEERGLLRDIERLTKTQLPQKPMPTLDLAAIARESTAARAERGADRDDDDRSSRSRSSGGSSGRKPMRQSSGHSSASSSRSSSSRQGSRQGSSSGSPSAGTHARPHTPAASPVVSAPAGIARRGRGTVR